MRWALPLLALVCGLAVLTLPAGAAGPGAGQPVVIEVDENVSSTDGPTATPPAGVGSDESVNTTDAVTVTPPGTVSDAESVSVSDAVTVTPPGAVSDDESVGVSDEVTVTPPQVVSDDETVGVSDAVGVLPPANAGSDESASVSDSVSVVPQALATTTVLTASPNPALAGAPVQLQAAVTSSTHAVDSGTVTFEDGSTPLGQPVQVDASGDASVTVSSLVLGTHTLTATYSGTPTFLASSGTASEGIYDYSLSVAPASTVLRGGTALYNLTLSLTPGSVTSGLPASVPLTVGNLPADASSNAPATIPFPQSVGSPTSLTVSVPTGIFTLGDSSLLFTAGARSASAALHIYDYVLSLTPGSKTIARGATATFALSSSLALGSSTIGLPTSLTLTASPGAVAGPLALPGSTTVSVATSQATPDGPQTVSVTANPGGRTASATLYVDVPPALHLPGPQTVDYHDPLSFAVSVTDPDAADHVTLSATGLPAGLVFTDNGNRTGSVSGTDTAAPGTYAVTVSANDGVNPPVSGTITVTVQREESSLAYTGVTGQVLNGSTVTLSGTLREDGTVPLAGKTVAFKLGSGATAQTCSGVTNASGAASCTIVVNQAPGPAPIAASFAGDVDYLGSSASSSIVVYTARSLKQGALTTASALLPSARLLDAILLKLVVRGVQDSLDASLWVDGNRLDPRRGDRVFDDEAAATAALDILLGFGSVPDATVQGMLGALVQADQILASTAISDAVAAHGNSRLIAAAQSELARAQAEAGRGQDLAAIGDYEAAWQEAEDAAGH